MSLGALLAGMLVTSAQGAITAFTNPGDGAWTLPLNWSNGVPGVGDLAIVGGNVNAENSDLILNTDATVDAINITDGMHFDTNGNVFSASNVDAPGIPEISISGANEVNNVTRPSRLIVTETNNMVIYDLSGRDVSINNEAELYFEETAEVLVSGTLETDNGGAVVGDGLIEFSGASPLNNNGIISVLPSATLTLDGFSGNNALFDLDGSNGNGQLDLSAVGSTLNVNNNVTGGQFDGTMSIGRTSSVNLASSLLRVGSNGNPGEINFTGLFNTGGTLSLDSGNGNLILQRGSTLTVSSGAATIDSDLRVDNFTTEIVVAKQQLAQAATSLKIAGDTRFFGGLVEVGGTVDFEGGISQSEKTSFKMTGGIVEGAGATTFSLTGDNNPTITGNGTWDIGLINDGSVEAQFGALTINGIGNTIDWDGPGNNGDLRAEFGSLVLKDEPGFQFRSDLFLGNGNSVTLEVPFSILDEDSRVVFEGEANESAGGTITSEGDLTIRGEVQVNNPSVIEADTTLEDTASITLDSKLSILAGGDLTIEQGVGFSGSGTLHVGEKSRMVIPVSTLLTGSLELAGKLVGDPSERSRVRINGDLDLISGDESSFLEMSVFGEATNVVVNQQWDRLTVDGTATLSGHLSVIFDVPGASVGDHWKIIQAAEVVGDFESFQRLGATPAGTTLIPVIADDGVYLKLIAQNLTYQDWADQQGFGPNQDKPGMDPDGDGLDNAAELYLGGNPLVNDSALIQPTGSLVTVGNDQYLSITVRKALHAEKLPVELLFAQSIDLEDWSPINLSLHSSEYDAFSCVVYETYRMTEPVQVRPKVFLRAEFVLP